MNPSNKNPIDKRTLTTDQLAQVEQWQVSHDQLQTLSDMASMLHELLNVLDDNKKTESEDTNKLGILLVDIRNSLKDITGKQDPKLPDYAAPVVKAVGTLQLKLAAAIKEATPNINVAAPNVQVDAPKIDLKGIEKLLKTDIPKAFSDAIASIPQPEPDDDTPLLGSLEAILSKLDSIDTATRLKVQAPNTVKVTNPDGTPITGGTITVNSAPTYKDDPTVTGETPKYGKTNSTTHKQQVEADTSGNDIATQTTLALIKAKTDNLDVALSTRTKPADQQHVIVDSGVTTGLTDTQLRATAVPVSGTVNPTTPTTVRNGQKVVAVTNTAIQLTAGACVGGVIQALAVNVGNVVIGDSSVTTANGFQLQPGQATGIAIDNINRLFVNGVAGDGVCWIAS